MRRWHEKHCRRPEIVTIDGLPYCNNCDALAPLPAKAAPDISEQEPKTKPELVVEDHTGLWWPPSIQFFDQNSPAQLDPLASSPSNEPQRRQHAVARAETRNEYHTSSHDTLEVNEIRLLHLDHGEPESVLHGEHGIVRITDSEAGTHQPGYDCLSYVRADAANEIEQTEVIYLGKFWDILCIPKTCAEALRHVRHRKGLQRVIWVDSVCINQDDQEEKSSQVGMIANIFSRARQVIAYLGSPCQASRTALNWLRLVDQPQGHMPTEISRKRKYGDGDSDPDVHSMDGCAAFMALLGRPYFRRMWPVLEFVVAQSVILQCGHDTAPWPLAGLSQDVVIVPDWVSYRERRAAIGELDLLPLLKCTASNSCTDPRDRIFSMLGLIRRWDDSAILPSYKLSVEEVFIGIAAYVIKKHNALGSILILASTMNSSNGGLKLPSWVPNWNSLVCAIHGTGARSFLGGLTQDELPVVQAKWQFTASELFPEVHKESGFLQVQAILLSPSFEPFFRAIKRDGNTVPTLGSPYQTFSASWSSWRDGIIVKENDQLAFIAGRFVILRPTSGRNGYYGLVQTLDEDVIYSIPLSVAGIDEIDWGDEDDHGAVFERLERSMFTATTGQPSDAFMASRRIKPMNTTAQEQISALCSDVFGITEPDHEARTDDASIMISGVCHARFIKARRRLLDVALYSRMGYFQEERELFQDFTQAMENFRSCDSNALASLASHSYKLDTPQDSVAAAFTAQMTACTERWCLGNTMEKLDLGDCGSPISTLVKWLQSTERLLAFLSSDDRAENWRLNSGLPGGKLGKTWLLHWAGFFADTIANSANSPHTDWTPDEFIISAILRHVIDLAKVAVARIPDFDRIGLAELPRIMGERRAVSDRVDVLDWVQHAFWTANISHLSDFDQDMVVRLEMWPLGLDLDREETIVIM